jgi:hypothetical protein
MDPKDAYLSEVTLLTDHEGAALKTEAAIQQVYDIPEETLRKWQEAGRAATKTAKLDGLGSVYLHPDERKVYSVGAAKGKHGKNNVCCYDEDEGQDLLDKVDEFRKKGVLAQVLGSDMSVSSGRMEINDRVSKRYLNSGGGDEKHISVSDELLFRLYLLDNFSFFTEKKEREAMSYEVEYIICGKDSDEENLRSVVKRLLAMREAENMLSLSKDSTRRGEAEAMAATVSAAVLNPELEPVITLAILAAWSYVESVLDVRLLLSGGKVPLVKSPNEWTSELALLPEYFDTDVKARNVGDGIDYKGYLFALLTVTGSKKSGLRPLDIMEEELHRYEDYGNVRMDNMLTEATLSITMTGTPLFLSFAPLVSTELSTYEFEEENILSYL